MSGIVQNVIRQIEAKTASYRVGIQDLGKILTNRGAGGAVTYTLPALADIPAGWWVEFFGLAAQNWAITAPANKLSTFNNLTATTATFSQASELIGGGARVVYDGTTYLLFLMTEETQTVAIT